MLTTLRDINHAADTIIDILSRTHLLTTLPSTRRPTTLRDPFCPARKVAVLPFDSQVKRWEEFPNATFTFDCTGRSIGFYADLEFDCQIFHLCDAQGRRVPYMCDKNTAFNQKFRVCDWAYNVDCEAAPNW